MKYTYLGHNVYIKEPVGVYLSMCKELKKINEDVKQKLNNTILYNSDNHFETLVSIVLSSVSEGVSTVVNSLNRLGWNISEKEFVVDEAECFEVIISVLEKYEDDYYNIIQEIAGMEAYRNIRQATRGRFMGGGQGIDGIITGALTAEAANLVVGAGHTVANFIGNVGTRLKVEKKTQNLTKRIRDLLLKEKLIEVTMKNLEVVFLQKCSHPDCGVYLQEYDTNHMEYDVTPELLRISDAEQKRQAYFSILESIPYCPIIYKTLLLEYGDSQKELQILARDYGIDLDRIKKDLLRKEAAKLSKDNGNIIEQMSELERKYSYYDGQLEQEIHKKYLERFIVDNDVDYLSETEVGKRIKFLNEFSKQYQCNIDMYLRNIKECILMAYHIDLSCEKSLQELETLKEKIMHLSITYELNFDEYITVIQNKISKASLEIEKEEKEKRTVYDVSDITMQQGIIKKRKVILDSQEEAQNVQKRIDEICGLFDAMNFEMCDKKLFEQFSNLQEKASEFPYCEKVIALVKTKQSQMKLEADSSKADMPSDGVKEENKNSCLSCGAIIKEFYRFCPKCGKSLIINSDTEENVSKESVPEDVIHYENQKIVDEHNVKEDIDLDNKTEKKQIGVQDIIDYTKSGGFKSEGCKKSFDELCTCLNDNETVTSILGYLNTLSQNYKECATQVANKTLMDKIINGGVSRYFGMDEKALFYKDSAILFLGKEGTLITNKAIYRIKKSGVCKILLSELESINLIDIVNGSNENNACRWCFNHNKDFNLDAVGTNAPQQAGIIIALICLLFIEINPDRKLKFFNFI